jgi:hypothetical protein
MGACGSVGDTISYSRQDLRLVQRGFLLTGSSAREREEIPTSSCIHETDLYAFEKFANS